MQDHFVLFQLVRFFVPASVVLTAYLYCYPLVNICAFPSPRQYSSRVGPDTCILDDNPFKRAPDKLSEPVPVVATVPEVAPFRLLAFGDPQLEGDSSLPELKFPGWNSIYEHVQGARYREALGALGDGAKDYPKLLWNVLKYVRKQVDLLGNDYYLAHIYRTLLLFTDPTHVTVLGDLLGSQWISDEEFERRSRRYWTRVFRNAQRVPPELLGAESGEQGQTVAHIEPLGADSTWRRRLINLAGNHDVGYAGDINPDRLGRFEREFGPVNGDIMFSLNITTAAGETPVLRVLILNSMNMDGPAFDSDLQQQTYAFVNSAIAQSLPVESHHHATILLTHIPLHKEPGICVDAPFFDYYEEGYGSGVREQNMLSADMSTGAVLHGLFGKSADPDAPARGLGRDGIILTGHDHAGCDVYHYVDRASGQWKAAGLPTAEAQAKRRDADVPGLREVTVRSMMGEYGGNAALVSAWWDEQDGRWRIEVNNCLLGVQHIWWAVHILDIVTLTLCLWTAVVCILDYWAENTTRRGDGNKRTLSGNGMRMPDGVGTPRIRGSGGASPAGGGGERRIRKA